MKLSIFLLSGLMATQAFGASWEDLWKRRDEQGYEQFKAAHFKEAAQLFNDVQWQGAAYYRGGDYKKAQEAFAQGSDKLSYYNLGNVLAQQGEFQQAIQAYEKALEKDPGFEDAKYNRDLLEKLLKTEPPKEQASNSASYPPSDSPQEKKENNNDSSQESQENKKTDQGEQPLTSDEESLQQSQLQEQAQAKQQFMRQVPDEPGGLLRQKFLRDHQRYSSETK